MFCCHVVEREVNEMMRPYIIKSVETNKLMDRSGHSAMDSTGHHH